MLPGKTLENPDCNWLVNLTAITLRLAGMSADKATTRGEGNPFPDNSQSLGKFTFRNEADIASCINTSGAGLAARRR